MKKAFTILLLSLFGICLYSQKVTVSDDISLRSDDAYALIGKMKDRILLYHYRGNKHEIQAFDQKLRSTWNKELKLDRNNANVIEVFPRKANFTVVYYYRRKGQIVLKAHRYDPAANLLDSVTIARYEAPWHSPRVYATLAENKNNVVLYSIEKQSQIRAYSYDIDNLVTLWGLSFSPEDMNAPHDYEDFLVDNQGNFFFIMEKDNRRVQLETHHFDIYRCRGKEVERMAIPFKEQLTYDVKFTVDNLNKRLVAGGMYSEKNRGRANGYFLISLNPRNPDDYAIYYKEFNDELIGNISGRGVDEEKGISECDIQDIVLRRDGGALLISERNRRFERRTAGVSRGYVGQDGSRYIVDYYYDDLFAVSLHPDGQEHWGDVFHKRQYSQDDGAVYSSYFLLKTPSSLRLIFNDEIRNENTVSEYVIKGNGTHERNSVLSTESQNIRLRFRDAVQVSANSALIPSEKRNRLRLVLVEY